MTNDKEDAVMKPVDRNGDAVMKPVDRNEDAVMQSMRVGAELHRAQSASRSTERRDTTPSPLLPPSRSR